MEYVGVLGQWRTQDFFFRGVGSTNSVEDREQRERGSRGVGSSGVMEAAVIWYKKFHFI